jgi:hypothetical protein
MCSSTTPKTKAASNAVKSASTITKPALGSAGAGGAGGAGATPPITFGGPKEHVPQLTFIVQPRVAGDDYLAGATTYHTNCGLQPREIHSFDHMLDMLATDTSALQRIRIVSHASGVDLLVPMFGQTLVQNDRHTLKEQLIAFADSDELGLLGLVDLGIGNNYYALILTDVADMLRTVNAPVLAPFALDQHGTPSGDLKRLIEYGCDYCFVNGNLFKKNNGALAPNEKTGLLKALNSLMNGRGKLVVGKTFGAHTVTSGDVSALITLLKARSLSDLGLTTADAINNTMAADEVNRYLLAGNAADAVDAGFRSKLTKVRARFSKNSFIDIRGCRIGGDKDYMRAVQTFMGQPDNVPQVTGPQWYQAFAFTNSYDHPNSVAQINALLHTNPAAATIRDGFAAWLTMTGMNPGHKKIWSDILAGPAAKFSLPDWKNTLPDLPVATPAITPFKAMNFTDTVTATANFFNVPAAAKPNASQLSTAATFVTSKLTGWGPNLFFVTDASTPAPKLTDLYNALKGINTDLGQSIVPGAPPSPLKPTDITGWQTQLAASIDANQLAPIKTFMTAVKARIDDANDPGMYYYALQTGMPVFIFAPTELVNDHKVNITNHRLVVWDAVADAAYRLWPPLLWAEPLPAANTIGTLHAANTDARRFAMMVQDPTGGQVPVAACPNQSYADKLTSV